AVLGAEDLDREAVSARDVARDADPEAAASLRAGTGWGRVSRRRREEARDLGFGEAGPVVGHAQPEAAPRLFQDDRDVAGGVVVADRVVDRVADGLLEQRHVARDPERLLGHGELELDLARPRDRMVASDGPLDERVQVDRIALELGLGGLELR